MSPKDVRIRKLALASLMCAFATPPALAASPAPGFKTFDSNGDGVVSLEEFSALGGQAQAFRAADTNGDNHLDKEEFARMSGDKAPPAKQ